MLTAYDRAGNELGDFMGHEGDVYAIAPSPDGRFLVSGAADQTVRLWNLKTRELLVTLFHGADGEWVMWTPQGYYAASPEGDAFIGWQINLGPDREADYVRTTQLARRLYRPGIVARAPNSATKPEAGEWEPRSYSVPLQHGVNEIAVTARNDAGETTHKVVLRFDGRGQLDQRGTLFIIAVGVDEYDHYPDARLHFAAKDARAFCDHMARHSGPLHKAVESRLLIKGGDAEPTCDNIENALTLFRTAQAEDTVVLFLAGHGTTEPTDDQIRFWDRITRTSRSGDYLFLPQNASADGNHWLPTSVVPWTTFERSLHNADGLKLMFVDTCHAHGAYDSRMVHRAGYDQIVTFSATDSGKPSFEDAELRHGVFTFALTQGLAGRAADGDAGEVRLGRLQDYVAEQVKSLTNGGQTPTFRLTGVKNFVIARKA